MKKNIYASIFYTILGLCINTPANASIISRSFLDEALTDYATTTALDLKANQSDFRELNTQISDSVDLLRDLLIRGSTSYKFVNNINPEKFPNTIGGAFGLLYQYLDGFAGSILYGWTDENGTSYAGFDALNNGWTDSEKNTYLGVKGLNDKIALPSGDMRPSKGLAFLLPDTEYYTYPTSIGDFMGQMYNGYLGLSGLADAVYHGSKYTGQTDTALQVKGLRQITDEIGTLPTGEVPQQKAWTEFLSSMNQNYDIDPVYPTSLARLMELLFGIGGSVNNSGILPNMFLGIPVDIDHDGRLDNNETLGIYSNFLLAKQATDAIGTLPIGSLLGNSPAMDALFISTQGTNTPVFPNSLSDLINQLYGSTEGPGTISALLHGFEYNESNFSDEYDGNVGILPAMELGISATQAAKTALETANRAKALAESNATAIGTLPTALALYEYDANGTLGNTRYPTADVFGTNNNIGGMLTAILIGFGDTSGHRVLSLPEISTRTVRLSDQIGTLPSGSLLGNSPAMDTLFISTQGTNTPVFPVSLSDLINQLYGSTEGPGAISALLHGFDFTLGEYNGPVGVLPAMELSLSATQIANRAKALAESNATAIGTLPDGYETVGAALSAIKGIAEEAKAAALAAIPDPKTEGSNGKYVLTVDIIGDNATYRWEPIDRSNTTTTTE